MSIGKNAIKRVENNGYSHVASYAPDMENSVTEPAAAEPAEKPVKRKIVRKTPPAAEREGGRVQVGEELPVWLL